MSFRSLSLSAFVLIFAGFTTSAWAENVVTQIENCTLDQSLNLANDTQIICDGDLVISEGVEVTLSANHELQIFVHGLIVYPRSGFVVNAQDAAVSVAALTATGLLKVNGGDISLEYGSSIGYDQELHPDTGSQASMIRNGEVVALAGPMLKPAL